MSVSNCWRSLALVISSVWVLSAQAQECFQKSVHFIDDGDAYYDLETSYQVPHTDQKQFIALAGQLGENLIGQAHREECLGGERNPRMHYEDAEVKASIQANLSSGMQIHAQLNQVRTKIIKQQLLAFLGSSPSFYFVNYGGGHFSFSQKSRHKLTANSSTIATAEKPAAGGNRLEESMVDVRFTGNGLLVRIDHYANGFFYASDNWELTATR